MGLSVALETESGELLDQVIDPKNILHRILPPYDDLSFQCLRFIDWYGDTVFNELQIDLFLSEVKRIEEMAQTEEERELLDQIKALAVRVKSKPHLYLKFYGD